MRLADGAVLRMQAAHPHPPITRHQVQLIAHRHLAAVHRAGGHRAHTVERERAVDGQAEMLAGTGAHRLQGGRGQQPRLQFGHALPAVGTHRQHRRGGQRCGRQQHGHLGGHGLQARGIDPVAFGQRHQALLQAQQRQHRQVLAGLRHHTIVGGHQQQREIDAGGAGQHGVHQALMPRHIDEADAHAARRIEEGIAQLDADAALLFFGQAVGVHAGERTHQRGLAVVDVAGGADDHG